MVRVYVIRCHVSPDPFLLQVFYKRHLVTAVFPSKIAAEEYIEGDLERYHIEVLRVLPISAQAGLVVKIGHSWRVISLLDLSSE